MNVICCDLDNTLIYSYKYGTEGVCVEEREGKQLSFMSGKAYQALARIREKALFIPVTTRSMAQYQRIRLFRESIPKYALTSDGGNLFINGKQDISWLEESRRLGGEGVKSLETVAELLTQADGISFDIRIVDGLFVFTKSHNPAKTAEFIRSRIDRAELNVSISGNKVYVMPAALNKGVGLMRLKELAGEGWDTVIACGDSILDIPMLLQADRAVMPAKLAEEAAVLKGPHIITVEGDGHFLGEQMLDIAGTVCGV